MLYGLPKCTVSGLQVRNSAVRFVSQESLRDHEYMSRAMMELHWLPVDKRIEYKLLLYAYKALHGLASAYLCELVVPYAPRRVIRSAEANLITVLPGKPGKYGSISFVRASANLWYSLRGERVQRLPPARDGTAQRNIFYLANWSQLIHPGPSSSRSSFLMESSQSCAETLSH